MTNLDVDARRIREAFDRDLANYHAPPSLPERARLGGLRRAGRLRRLRRLTCAGAVACAAAVAITAIAPWAGPAPESPGSARPTPTPPGPRSTATAGSGPAAGLPSAASVSKAMLASFQAASGDILYEWQIGIHHGAVVDEYRDWFWPGQPVPGQQARERETVAQTTPGSGRPLSLTEDWGAVYSTPVTAKTSVLLTTVCFAAEGCGYDSTQTPGRTWSRVLLRTQPGLSDISPGSPFNPAMLAQAIARGQWRILRRTRLDGQPTIELSETAKGPVIPLPQLLWVNARTYLPLRCTGPDATLGFAYLPPTRANLAALQVPIPRGFPRSDSLKG
jgi:hypothetical protein